MKHCRALNTSYSSSMYNQDMKPLDYLYGPWKSIEQMTTELHVDVDEIEIGLTIGIISPETGSVVEYWNPTPGRGFIPKYLNDTGSGNDFGDYVLNFGEFPESEDMMEDEILPVTKDGAAKVSDVYRIFKIHQLASNKAIDHLNSHVKWMVSDLDKYTGHDHDKCCDCCGDDMEYGHSFISRVENTHGKITLKHDDLDTGKVLMDGRYIGGNCLDVDNKAEGDFIVVQNNIGGYRKGDVIKNGTTLEEVLKKILGENGTDTGCGCPGNQGSDNNPGPGDNQGGDIVDVPGNLIWCNMIYDPDEEYVIEEGDTITDISNYGDSSKIDFDSYVEDYGIVIKDKIEIKTESHNKIYIICPDEFKVVYDSALSNNVNAVRGGSYTYVLNDDKTTSDYVLYFMLNFGTYNNIRLVRI